MRRCASRSARASAACTRAFSTTTRLGASRPPRPPGRRGRTRSAARATSKSRSPWRTSSAAVGRRRRRRPARCSIRAAARGPCCTPRCSPLPTRPRHTLPAIVTTVVAFSAWPASTSSTTAFAARGPTSTTCSSDEMATRDRTDPPPPSRTRGGSRTTTTPKQQRFLVVVMSPSFRRATSPVHFSLRRRRQDRLGLLVPLRTASTPPW
mmetsp:Transcript_6549/g.27544  ORF Transcript_6549/g.27544 Transcript_6549/m.27544 type:complete len:208 (+) Transcript_6549:517-1140(+)